MNRFIRSRHSIRSSYGIRRRATQLMRRMISRARSRRVRLGAQWAALHRAQLRRRNIIRYNRQRNPEAMRVFERPPLMNQINDYLLPSERYNFT